MLIELDYETVAALESALIVAEISKTHDAEHWAKIADVQETPECRQAAEGMAAFCQGQADKYHWAMGVLQRAKKEAPASGGQTSGAKGI